MRQPQEDSSLPLLGKGTHIAHIAYYAPPTLSACNTYCAHGGACAALLAVRHTVGNNNTLSFSLLQFRTPTSTGICSSKSVVVGIEACTCACFSPRPLSSATTKALTSYEGPSVSTERACVCLLHGMHFARVRG